MQHSAAPKSCPKHATVFKYILPQLSRETFCKPKKLLKPAAKSDQNHTASMNAIILDLRGRQLLVRFQLELLLKWSKSYFSNENYYVGSPRATVLGSIPIETPFKSYQNHTFSMKVIMLDLRGRQLLVRFQFKLLLKVNRIIYIYIYICSMKDIILDLRGRQFLARFQLKLLLKTIKIILVQWK